MKLFRALFLAAIALALLGLPAVASAGVSTTCYLSVVTNQSIAMPQTTKRQAIVDEWKLRMQLIDSTSAALVLPDGSTFQFQTDIGKNPINEWAIAYNQDELAAAYSQARISVFDLVRDREQDFPDQRNVLPMLSLQTRVYKLRGVTPAELRKMLGDIARAAVTNRTTRLEDRTLAGLAVNIYPDSDGFELPKETFELEFGAVSFNIAHLVDPFGQ